MTRTSTVLTRICAASVVVGTTVLALAAFPGTRTPADQQAPVFRSTVDLVAVDVQVVDDTGTPIDGLTPDDFEVSIAGKRRRIVSAEFVRSSHIDDAPFRPSALPPLGANTPVVEAPADGGRLYILAFDVGSLSVGDSRAIVGSAVTFIDRLLPSDRVGLHAFPIGPHLDPTTDHAVARRLVNDVVGSRSNSEGFNNRFNLSPSEIIDITAEAVHVMPVARGGGGRGASMDEDLTILGNEADTIRAVQVRECGLTEVHCGDEIRAQATELAFLLEGRATEALHGIRSLVNLLSSYEGRKTVVMFSSGMPTSDRPGGRPDLGNLPAALGRDAAATNTTIYTVHVDSGQMRAIGAANSRAAGSMGSRGRDFAVEGQVLEEFAGASGGALLRVTAGSGEYALDRVLRETSSHYLLGVEPDESDRDGTLRELRVDVDVDDVTVRSREWVVVPRRPS